MVKDRRAEIKVDPKVELEDYSGTLNPDLRYSDFSRERLVRGYLAAQEYLLEASMAWASWVGEKFGLDAMIEGQTAIWADKMEAPAHRLLTKGWGIKGNDIAACMKSLQMDLGWAPSVCNATFEMPSEDRGVITIYKCKAVDILEPLGDMDTLMRFCKGCCPTSNEKFGKFFNPDIVLKTLAIPPRKSKDDLCCKWEYTYKSK